MVVLELNTTSPSVSKPAWQFNLTCELTSPLAIFNLLASAVLSLMSKVPPFTFISKSGFASESTKLTVGAVELMIILPALVVNAFPDKLPDILILPVPLISVLFM